MRWVALAVVLLLAGPAMGDIIEWQDADGVRHFTNLKDDIPKEYRDGAHVVIDEVALNLSHKDAPVADAAPVPSEPRREAEVVYDQSATKEAYLEGLVRGLQAAQGQRDGGGGNAVTINGPLAVASAAPSALVPALPYYGYTPLVTVPFDGGRSRHRTVRMLLQDEFAFDREYPFFYPMTPPVLFPTVFTAGRLCPGCPFGR